MTRDTASPTAIICTLLSEMWLLNANPLKARLHVYAPTGLFTGQFSLRTEDPANSGGIITRTVQYRGIFLPAHGIAAGHFLLPTLPDPEANPPTKPTTSPIISGSVLIEAAAP